MNQLQYLINHLHERSITQRQAEEFYGIRRLAARIYDLRKSGWLIESTQKRDPGGGVVKTYRLLSKERATK